MKQLRVGDSTLTSPCATCQARRRFLAQSLLLALSLEGLALNLEGTVLLGFSCFVVS